MSGHTKGVETGLRSAYARCARMQLRHDPTFFWATQRLPRDVRPAVHALYGYVRAADELVDGPGRPDDPAERRARLDAWERALDEGRARGGSGDPIVAALVDAAHRHRLPLDELRVYMRSMRVDCGPVRIGTREELDAYMDGSAAAVGRIMAPLLGAPDRGADVARLGVAFQLTNFIRDVREDWEMDRVYLPGLPEDDLARRRATARVRERVADEVARARSLFAATAHVPEACDPAVRPGMRIARAVYGQVLDRVERVGFDVVRRRAGLWPWEVARAVLRA
ncbi:MAG TPA: phytoene/squalene synthase family protein [Solirubrobacteraceae bacterium]|nr:phytoene/squalene synthase family protein [Solirubrobacteraceae bacterium]